MARASRRDRVLAILAVMFAAGAITFAIGPTYLNPLPMWLKLVLIVAGCCFIASVAIFSRRRARRAAPLR